MADRKIKVERLDLAGETQKKLAIEVYYSEGVHLYTSHPKPRGFYLSVTPKIYDGVFEKYTPVQGAYALLEEAKRFSRKRLEAIAAEIRGREEYQVLVGRVLERNGLKLKEIPA